jgi:2',3'-cyclic-nucleotide 2'-phosphodiesterase (5'-nucleotidase family)
MRRALLTVIALLARQGSGAQPDAVPPYQAPLRDLPWSQLNILHTTDTHGWLGGHLTE